MATEQELDYIAKHPGSFDREFFEEQSMALLEQWRRWADVDEDGYIVEVLTADDRLLNVAYARFAQTWAAFFTEDMSLELVPYKEIIGLTYRARSKEAPRRFVGFSAESV